MKYFIMLLAFLTCLCPARFARADASLSFEELYSGGGVLGLQFSDKVKSLTGQRVVIKGFMAPPLKAEASFFVLTREPVALCPFCQTDADWPDNILVVYLSSNQQFVQNNATIEVEGVLETGSWRDAETGFLSQLRLRDASFRKL
ncbi:hypothetical protein [uncultured Bilophila sp.]|uniref:hypothetical protein n=1 Tax=uncultured Bilophila sp. TaxID=529385 RepID=UPI0025EDDAE3|nr:hypothetical protein [uncultured Bilophila sp.]